MHSRWIVPIALASALAVVAPCSAAGAQEGMARRPTEVALYLGGGQWLPRPDPIYGLGHGGGRAVVGLQVERAVGRSGWAVAASVAGAVFPGGCAGVCPGPGTLVDAAVTRRVSTPGEWGFAYVGVGPGVVSFDETRLAAGARAGLGLGTRGGVRIEGRRQYLFGADDPHAYSVTVGVHVRW